ncbi:MAG: AEC family transporter [Spirochaetes bacterium]|jgi:predicted permease|nr:AEC family transporter [Spirochaetota bacterium]
MEKLNYQFLLSLCIVLAGFGFRRSGILSRADGEALSRLVLNITLPALILDTFSSFTMDGTLAVLPVVCVAFSVMMSVVSYRVFRNEEPARRGILTISAMGFNIGLFAFPLIEGVWGTEGLRYIAMFDMGNALIVFLVCYLAGSYLSPLKKTVGAKQALVQILTFFPFMSYLLSLVLNLSGVGIPPFASDVIRTVARANMSLALLLIGIYLDFSLTGAEWRRIAKVLALRYSLGIAVGAALYILLPVGPLHRGIIAIGLILPVGMSTIPYAVEFGYDTRLAGMMVNATNILSFIIMWIISALIINA